jgi:hypothetical protein
MALALRNEFFKLALGDADLVAVAPVLQAAVADAVVNRGRMQADDFSHFLDGVIALDCLRLRRAGRLGTRQVSHQCHQ